MPAPPTGHRAAGDRRWRIDPIDPIRRLIGVYDADGTVFGELSYFVRARLGRAHCALCDITHGRVRERPDWRAARADLPVAMETFHRDDQPDDVRAAVAALPVVVAEHASGAITVLLDADQLAACAASPERLVTAINDALRAHQLRSVRRD